MSNMEKIRVLLTGYSGQVGGELRKAVPSEFALILAEDDSGNFLDLSDRAGFKSIIAKTKPHIILNPAAYTAVDKAETEPDLARAINTDSPKFLAEEAAKIDALLVHYSTDYVFNGDVSHAPWKETDTTGPLNVYGRTKLDGEIAIVESGCKHFIFRTSWVYASHGHNFVKSILRLAAEREELKIVADQIGAPTAAKFLADHTWGVLGKFAEKADADLFGTYHLVNGGSCSWHEFATEIVRIARSNFGVTLKVKNILGIPSAEYPTPAPRPQNSRLNCQKFSQTFNEGRPLEDWRKDLEMVLAELLNS